MSTHDSADEHPEEHEPRERIGRLRATAILAGMVLGVTVLGGGDPFPVTISAP
jgi:hypothetical protein